MNWPGVFDEIEGAARELARRGLTGAVGDSLPNLMGSAAVSWINANQSEFQRMVELEAADLNNFVLVPPRGVVNGE